MIARGHNITAALPRRSVTAVTCVAGLFTVVGSVALWYAESVVKYPFVVVKVTNCAGKG